MRPIVAMTVMIAGLAAPINAFTSGSSDPSSSRGTLTGSKAVSHPAWFLESFLDIAEDASAAGKEGKHVILFFDSPGCPYCFKMIEENFKGSWYTDFIRENFYAIALNIHGDREVAFSEDMQPTEKELARLLNVRFTPTMLFLDGSNSKVLRIDGYRSVDDFKHLLDYVHEKAYLHSKLGDYLAGKARSTVYGLRAHPDFETHTDLSSIKNKPLMILFEDETCSDCDALHDNILSRKSTRELMKQMVVVRLDALSNQPIINTAGRQTTPRQWALELDLTYRPGTVFFDDGREVFRIDAFRYTFHFQQALRYVMERQWRHYERYSDYARAHRKATLDSGVDINVAE